MISLAKNKKVFNTKVVFLSLVAAIFMVVLGAVFSIITGYKAKEHEVLLQLFVWFVDIVISYSLSWLIFKWGKNQVKYLNWIAWGLSIIICTILVIAISGTFELLFVSIISAIIPLGGYLIDLIKKNYYNVKVQRSSKKDNKTTEYKKKHTK